MLTAVQERPAIHKLAAVVAAVPVPAVPGKPPIAVAAVPSAASPPSVVQRTLDLYARLPVAVQPVLVAQQEVVSILAAEVGNGIPI